MSWVTIMMGIHGYLSSITFTDSNNVIATGFRYSIDNARFGILFRTQNGVLTCDSISYEACGSL